MEGHRLIEEFYALSARHAAAEEQYKRDSAHYDRLEADQGLDVACAYIRPREDAYNAVSALVSDVRDRMTAFVLKAHGVALDVFDDGNPSAYAVVVAGLTLVAGVNYCDCSTGSFIVLPALVRHLETKESQ